jgi:glutathione S-transferase
MTLPILYSLRHCPFAMRARLAIFKSKEAVELRDVKLTNKPEAMLIASQKGTVPILVVSQAQVIDESLDVMLWSLGKNDPDNLLLGYCKPHCSVKQSGNVIESKSTIDTKQTYNCADLIAFIDVYDRQFKPCLERYKAAKRYHETNIKECREACEKFIEDLDKRLSEHDYIFGECESLADIAILPFIRQFAKVERQWYVQSSYFSLKIWLDRYLQSAMFNKIMAQHPIWEEGSEVIVFCGG